MVGGRARFTLASELASALARPARHRSAHLRGASRLRLARALRAAPDLHCPCVHTCTVISPFNLLECIYLHTTGVRQSFPTY